MSINHKIYNKIQNIFNFINDAKINKLIKNNTIIMDTELFGNEYGGFNVCSTEKSKRDGIKIVMSFGI